MNKYTTPLECVANSIEVITTPTDKHLYTVLACPQCNSKTFCENIRRVVEKHLNYKLAVK